MIVYELDSLDNVTYSVKKEDKFYNMLKNMSIKNVIKFLSNLADKYIDNDDFETALRIDFLIDAASNYKDFFYIILNKVRKKDIELKNISYNDFIKEVLFVRAKVYHEVVNFVDKELKRNRKRNKKLNRFIDNFTKNNMKEFIRLEKNIKNLVNNLEKIKNINVKTNNVINRYNKNANDFVKTSLHELIDNSYIEQKIENKIKTILKNREKELFSTYVENEKELKNVIKEKEREIKELKEKINKLEQRLQKLEKKKSFIHNLKEKVINIYNGIKNKVKNIVFKGVEIDR